MRDEAIERDEERGASEAAGNPDAVLNPGDAAASGAPSTGENLCRDCGGTGQRDGAACPTCGGTGRVIEAISAGP